MSNARPESPTEKLGQPARTPTHQRPEDEKRRACILPPAPGEGEKPASLTESNPYSGPLPPRESNKHVSSIARSNRCAVALALALGAIGALGGYEFFASPHGTRDTPSAASSNPSTIPDASPPEPTIVASTPTKEETATAAPAASSDPSAKHKIPQSVPAIAPPTKVLPPKKGNKAIQDVVDPWAR